MLIFAVETIDFQTILQDPGLILEQIKCEMQTAPEGGILGSREVKIIKYYNRSPVAVVWFRRGNVSSLTFYTIVSGGKLLWARLLRRD
jgi:hypothetical protein